MNKYFYLFIVFLITGCSSLSTKETIKAEIYQYGLYETVGIYFTEDNKAVPSGKFGKSTGGVKFLRQTDQIPLIFGVRFGYDFRIYGLTGKTVKLRCVVTHPPITRQDGEISTVYEYEKEFDVVEGVVDDGADYYINHDYELVPGKWTRTYYYQDQKILHKEFHVSSEYNQL